MLTCEWLRTLRIISYVPPHLGNIKSPVMMLSNIEVNNVTKPRRTHIMGFFFFFFLLQRPRASLCGRGATSLTRKPDPFIYYNHKPSQSVCNRSVQPSTT